MATGLACIATQVGGHNEVIENEVNGLLIPPRSVKSIVVAIEQVTGNEELRTCMGQKARARMITFGDYQLNAGKLLALFNSQKS
jgi:glycosyltransferase involved in cell wall biosynthesis